jgi:hypothetical protein
MCADGYMISLRGDEKFQELDSGDGGTHCECTKSFELYTLK